MANYVTVMDPAGSDSTGVYNSIQRNLDDWVRDYAYQPS